MTNIQNHVTSLELSKRLKELGVKQESLFYWNDSGLGLAHCQVEFIGSVSQNNLTGQKPNFYSAFLASELGEMLPFFIEHNGKICNLVQEKTGQTWYLRYKHETKNTVTALISFKDDTEVDALAKMLIYLLENNLLSVNDVNK